MNNILELIDRRTLDDGFTQSEFSDMSCMQRWNNRYNKRLQKQGAFSFALTVGSLWHEAQEQFYATKGKRVYVAPLQFPEGVIPSIQDHLTKDYWNAVLPRMMEAYSIYYKDDFEKLTINAIETELDVMYKGFRLRGKIDLDFNDIEGRWTMDHKTTGRLNKNIVAGWDFRFQFMFYTWLYWKMLNEVLKIKGFYVNATKKPELRVKKNESLPEFAQRVFQDMIEEPEKYFYREKMLLTREALQRFENETVNPKLAIIQYIVDEPDSPVAQALMINKNTEECQKWGPPCQFIELCQHGDKMSFLYDQKERKHLELEAVDIE